MKPRPFVRPPDPLRSVLVLAAALLVTLPMALAGTGGASVALATDRPDYHQFDLRPARDLDELRDTGGASRVWITFTNTGSTGVFAWACDAWSITTPEGDDVAAARSSFDWGYVVEPGRSVVCHWDLWDDRPGADPVTGVVPPGDYVVHWSYQTSGGWREATAPITVEAGAEV